MERRIFMLKRMGANVTELEEKLKEVEELIKQNRYQDAYRVMIQLQGEQMAMVKLHLHPGGHGMAKGIKVPHINHQNANNSQIGVGEVNVSHSHKK